MLDRRTEPEPGAHPARPGGGAGTRTPARGKLRSSSGRIASVAPDLGARVENAAPAPPPPPPAPSHDREEVILGVAHDLRSPLASILLAAQVLHTRDPDVDRRRRIDSIVRAAKRAILLVDNLSHLEEDGLPLVLEDHGLLEIVREALDLHGPQAEAASLALRLDDTAPGLLVHCDRAQLCRAVSNLVGNAVKFSPTGGHLTVRLERRDGGWARVSVTDEGPGLRAADLERVFERGYRGPDPTRRGLGLGLTITRAIAEAHGGRVGVHSRPGIGSTFWVEVPDRPGADLPP